MGTMLLLAVALSLDGFGVGLSYGLRRIRLPGSSLAIIALCTILTMGISMLLGRFIEISLGIAQTRLIGAAIIILLGCQQLWRTIRNHKNILNPGDESIPASAAVRSSEPSVGHAAYQLLKIQLNFMGLVIQVTRTPDLADMDGSGCISFRESFLLGFALALDAFASGIGAALAGMYITVIAIVALTQLIMIRLGQILAGKIPETLIKKAEFLPGLVLIIVGLGKLW